MTKRKDTNLEKLPNAWRAAFQSHSMRSSFCLNLTQPMLEYLCAIADGVMADRSLYFQRYGGAKPDNTLASCGALEKRGLIQDHPRRGRVLTETEASLRESGEITWWQLTPAGEAVVALLKVAGIFIEADAAIAKRARNA